MSTDTTFSPLPFPQLRPDARERFDARARAQGHAAGFSAGLREAAAETEALRARLIAEHELELQRQAEQTAAATAALETAAAALRAGALPVLAESQQVLAAAAIELAEAVIGRELATTADSARSALHRALGDADAVPALRVRMSPADLHAIDESTRSSIGVDLVADSQLGRGDAIAELPDGYLDARIGTALARAREALLDGDR